MKWVNVDDNPRIAQLTALTQRLSRANDPSDVLFTFAEGMRTIYGNNYPYMSLSVRGLEPGQYKITRFLRTMKKIDPSQTNPWARWPTIPVQTGGIIGEIIARGKPAILRQVNIPEDPILSQFDIHDCRSIMALPLMDEGQPLNWAVFFRSDPNAFDLEEMEDQILRGNLIGRTVKNVLVANQLRDAQQHIEAEVERIAAIQHALLPPCIPTIPDLDMALTYNTYDRAGGDLYDIMKIEPGPTGVFQRIDEDDCDEPQPGDRWAFLIGDVSGHGPSAAVVMAMVHSLCHAYPRMPEHPGEVLEYLNAHLEPKRIEHSFVTAFLAFYEPETRRLTYARAGHNPPVIKNGNSNAEPLIKLDEVGDIPLGVLPNVTYHATTITLEPGQTLVMYTDGITESVTPQGEMFGLNGLENSLADCTGQPMCVVQHVTQGLRNFEGGVQPRDDQTLIAIQIVEEAEDEAAEADQLAVAKA